MDAELHAAASAGVPASPGADSPMVRAASFVRPVVLRDRVVAADHWEDHAEHRVLDDRVAMPEVLVAEASDSADQQVDRADRPVDHAY